MKRFKQIFLFLLVMLGFLVVSNTNVSASDIDNTTQEKNIVNIYVFKTRTCYHCKELTKYLNELTEKYDNIVVNDYYYEGKNVILYNEYKALFKENGFKTGNGFPFTIVGGVAFSGDGVAKFYLEKYIEKYTYNDFVDVFQKYQNGEEIKESDFDKSIIEEINLPIFGVVNIKNVSLSLIAIILGFLDGINPCAMWILILLISLLIPTQDKKKIWLLGGTFLLTSGVFYFIMMLGWVSLVKVIMAKSVFLIIIGIFAICTGGYNLYKYIKSVIKKEDGCEVTNAKQKRTLTKKIKGLVNEKSIFIALGGIILIAIIVNFIELACSAGMPLLFSNILAINEVSTFAEISYTILYVIFFLIDDFIVFFIAASTLKIKAVSNKISKYSNLIGGIIMLILGILMLFFPNILMFSF